MPVIIHNDLTITVDEDGFISDLEDWSETVAHVLAAKEGITKLAEDQLDILKFMRDYYKKHKFFPIVRYVCKNSTSPVSVSRTNSWTRSQPGRSPVCRTPAMK